MAGENDRIAERLKEVEEGEEDRANGGMSADADSALDDEEITIGMDETAETDDESTEPDGGETAADQDPAPVSEISTNEILQSEPSPDEEEMSVAERLGTAADFEKRAIKLRQKAIEETEVRLEECFDRDVEVDLTPESDGTLTGEVRIPDLVEEMDGALDADTNVAIDHISVAVGDLEDESLNERT